MPSNSRRIPGLLLRGAVWHIDKVIYRQAHLREHRHKRAQALLARHVIQARRAHLLDSV
jgi:hypothetical protein